MLQSGFQSAPVTRLTLFSTAALSLLASLADVKFLFHVQVIPHLWQYGQWWRIVIWQSVYANAGELLFGCLLLYHMRVIERMFGSRRFGSFVAYSFVATSLLTPTLLVLLRPLTGLNYLPPGPTPLIFALLAQFHASVPQIYKFRFLFEAPSSGGNPDPPAVVLSDKLYVYILAVQLALAQPYGSLVGAFVGWVVGILWREEALPGSGWRLPSRWFVGRADVNDLRRRMMEAGAVRNVG